MIEEYLALHQSTLLFFRNISEKTLQRKGIANGVEFTINEIAHILAGHSQHHLSVLKERYLPNLRGEKTI